MQHVEECGDGWWQQGNCYSCHLKWAQKATHSEKALKKYNKVELWVQLAQSASGLTGPKDARGGGKKQKRQCHSQRWLQGNKASLCCGGAVSVV